VLFLQLRDSFAADDETLDELITNQMPDADEETVVCMSCYELYLAGARVLQCSRLQIPEHYGLAPRPFQPIVEMESFGKRDLPVGICPAMARPFSFGINLQESPYRQRMAVREPPRPERRRRGQAAASQGAWREIGRRPEKGTLRISAGIVRPPPVDMRLPEFANPKPPAVAAIPYLYGNPPFDIRILDPSRKMGTPK
jgi:hypothetical protein